MRRLIVVAALFFFAPPVSATEATEAEVAAFWDTVFFGPSPHGVPPLAATRSNERVVDGVRVFDVAFDSYRDPTTNTPLRVGAILAVPQGAGPFPGLVSTHSVGFVPPAEGLDTAVYYAQRGYAALAVFLRGYAPSSFVDPDLNTETSNIVFCVNAVDDGDEPFDSPWTGYAVDMFQAAEFLAAQPEVADPNGLAVLGHSLGGYGVLIAAIFSDRYDVIASSAPASSSPDLPAWMDFGNPIASCITRLPNPNAELPRVIRMISFIGADRAINNPSLVSVDASFQLDDASLWMYGGDLDPAVRPVDVEATARLADASNNVAYHLSPIGGHGGPESFFRAEAWLRGHFPGAPQVAPTASIVVSGTNGLTVQLDADASTDDDPPLVAYDWSFGDGTTKNTGPTVTHTYPVAGTYTASITVTDGAGLRSTATVDVTVGGGPAITILADVREPLVVDENGTATFDVTLSAAPAASLVVSVTASGDGDLAAAPPSLTFNAGNFDQPQTVTISAADDADDARGPATITLSSVGVPDVAVDVEERDDDATFSIDVATVAGAAGAEVVVPVSLANDGDARVLTAAATLVLDPALTLVSVERGAAVPGPAFWSFTANGNDVALEDIIEPDGTPIVGEIMLVTVVVDAAANGFLPITLDATTINGVAAGTNAGGIDVGEGEGGGEGEGEAEGEGEGEGEEEGEGDVDADGEGEGDDEDEAPAGCGCRASAPADTAAHALGLVALACLRRRRSPPSHP